MKRDTAARRGTNSVGGDDNNFRLAAFSALMQEKTEEEVLKKELTLVEAHGKSSQNRSAQGYDSRQSRYTRRHIDGGPR